MSSGTSKKLFGHERRKGLKLSGQRQGSDVQSTRRRSARIKNQSKVQYNEIAYGSDYEDRNVEESEAPPES